MAKYLTLGAGALAGMILMALLIAGYHASATPGLCIACHSMAGDGETWQMSNHKQFACIECHMPPSGIATKIFYKIRVGLHDLWHETFRDYPASLSISVKGREIAQGNCVRCHRSTIERISVFSGKEPLCVRCHRRIVHRAMKGLEE
jgi:cytochrome c nitrite reductase small subunit